MSHKLLAEIWKHLEKRLDIESLVQEIIGHHSLKIASTTNSSSQLRALSFELFVALRTIFDIQRTYLQSSDLESETSAYILDHDQLRLALQYLLHIKSQPHWCTSSDGFQYRAQLNFLAHTFISGFRALWLHPQQLSDTQISDFKESFDLGWARPALDDDSGFLIREICPRIIKELQEWRTPELAKPACGVFRLPDYESGLAS